MKTLISFKILALTLGLAGLLAACGGSSTGPLDAGDVLPEEAAAPDVEEGYASECGGGDACGAKDVQEPFEILDEYLEEAEVTPETVEVSAEAQAAIDKGKYWLINAEPVLALGEFKRALELAPGSVDATFGAALAEMVDATEFVGMVATMPAQFAGYGAGAGAFWRPTWPTLGALNEPLTENDYLAETMHDLIKGMRDRFALAADWLDKLEGADLHWDIERVPVYLGTEPFLMYRGTFDRSDLAIMRAVTDFCLWALDLLVAQDLHTDLLTAIVLVKDADAVDVNVILDMVVYLLEQDPRFLTINSIDGQEFFADGAARMAGVGSGLLNALEVLRGESPDEDQVSILDPEAADDTLVVRNRVDRFQPEGEQEVPFRMAFGAGVQADYALALEGLSAAGAPVPFDQGGLAQLTTVLMTAIKLDILKRFGVSLPIDLSKMEVQSALTLLRTLVPAEALALDWASFAQDPMGLRGILPLVAPGEDGKGHVLMEWECPEELAANNGAPTGTGGFFCSKDAVLVDAPHFVGTPYEIPADGLASGIPYLAWEDPTWHGLLYVDPTLVDGALGGEPGYAPATNWSLNVAVHGMLGKIIDLIAK
jgi:hypothetical protein